jgi:general secretion pathway protein H
MRKKFRGFTLVEVLIVMLIISIVGTAAILTVSRNENSRLENFSKQLSNLISLAEEQAMLQPAVLGLVFTPNTLRFYQYQESLTQKAEDKPVWLTLSDSVFAPHKIPKDMKVTLKVQGKNIPANINDENIQPQLVISSSGDPTPFIIQIGKAGAKPIYQITGSENGSIKSARIPDAK